MVKKYKVRIDRLLCIGAASCVALEPKVFALDSEAKAVLVDPKDPTKEYQGEYTYEVDEHEAEMVMIAAKSCPTNAIIITDEETGKQIYP